MQDENQDGSNQNPTQGSMASTTSVSNDTSGVGMSPQSAGGDVNSGQSMGMNPNMANPGSVDVSTDPSTVKTDTIGSLEPSLDPVDRDDSNMAMSGSNDTASGETVVNPTTSEPSIGGNTMMGDTSNNQMMGDETEKKDDTSTGGIGGAM